MSPAKLRDLHRAAPFQPFSINVADGRCIPVPHPDFLFLFPSRRTIMVVQEDDSFEFLDLDLVTGLEVKKSKKNGKKSS